MKSMTGYGRGEATQNGFKVTVELSSVNRKQSEINVYLPRELESLEARVRNVVNQHVARGRLVAKIGCHSVDSKASVRMELNIPLAEAFATELRKLARNLKLSEAVTLDHLLRAPGVLRNETEAADADEIWPAIEKALNYALSDLVQMRLREGENLKKDLLARMRAMQRSTSRIKKRAPEMVKNYQNQLRQRIKNAGLELPGVDDDRMLKEVIYFADRSDISEELTRLESHFLQFDEYSKSKEPTGRTLDFLAQEINREINTIGSKAQDSLVASEVVKLKSELEKFREQVQNVE